MGRAIELKNRKLALILSLLYCGVGQIYNGRMIKGIDFIILYTLIILASFFAPTHQLSIMARTAWPFMWVVGAADAYISETAPLYRKKYIRKWVLALLPGVVLSGLVSYIYLKPRIYSFMGWQAKVVIEDQSGSYGTTDTSGTSVRSISYSIQLGAFVNRGVAEKLRDELLDKGYPANVERLRGRQRQWYHVYAGNFQTRGEAIAFGEKLREQEGYAYVLAPRVTPKEEKGDKSEERDEDEDQGQ